MAGKFLSQEEAAQQLGISPDELIEWRSRGDIHGYRDGANWKFKAEEVQRVVDEKGLSPGGSGAEDDEDLLEVPDLLSEDQAEGDDTGDSILVSDPGPEETGSSTIIGKDDAAASAESDIQLADAESDILSAGSGLGSNLDESSVLSGSDPKLGPGDSDVQLTADESGGSDVRVVPTEGSDVLGDDELKLSDAEGSGAGEGTGELDLGGTDTEGSDVGLGSDELDLDDDDLALTDEDDDLVLGGSGMGSDVTLGGSDTGINLTSPSDSGLSLEDEPLELGSSISSLELPEDEDDDVISLEDAEDDPDSPTQLKKDEEFILSSPTDDADDEDSGSQVIALEDSEAFDADAATMVQSADPALVPTEEVEESGLEAFETPVDTGFDPGLDTAAAPTPAGQASAQAYAPAEPAQAAYSIWNVIGLLLIAAMLSLTGMIMTDIVRNMWSWETAMSTNTSLIDAIIGALKMD